MVGLEAGAGGARRQVSQRSGLPGALQDWFYSSGASSRRPVPLEAMAASCTSAASKGGHLGWKGPAGRFLLVVTAGWPPGRWKLEEVLAFLEHLLADASRRCSRRGEASQNSLADVISKRKLIII